MTARRVAELAAMYDALRIIADAYPPEKLRRIAQKKYGVTPGRGN